jgi:hypothetical protein
MHQPEHPPDFVLYYAHGMFRTITNRVFTLLIITRWRILDGLKLLLP